MSFEPISERLTAKSIHELSVESVWIDMIRTIWWAMPRELYGIVSLEVQYYKNK